MICSDAQFLTRNRLVPQEELRAFSYPPDLLGEMLEGQS